MGLSLGISDSISPQPQELSSESLIGSLIVFIISAEFKIPDNFFNSSKESAFIFIDIGILFSPVTLFCIL